ncbi:MAG TPA: hypothetical protein VL281_00370 [Mycobacteriales bacterium]|nr:hypothetical protein [Mycobacteriales bacterium]
MRWEDLFADLESQADAAEAAELAAEVAERTRHEVGRLRLVDRLRAAAGATVVVRVRGAGALAGRVVDVGADWALLEEQDGRAALVALREVLALSGVGARSDLPGSEGAVEQRLDLRYALRRLVRDRVAVEVVLVDGTVVAGTLDRVAADHVDLAQHAPDQARRARAVQQVLLLPLSAIALVRVEPR